MDKVLDFLEKYCQWLAVALGGLFLAWTLSTYVLFAPVTLQANGKTYTPGDIEDAVKTSSTDPLERLIKDPDPVQPPKKGTTDVDGEWQKLMNGDVQLAAIPSGWINSQTGDFKIKNDTGPTVVAQKIVALPTLPASEVVDLKAARAFVAPAVPVAGAAAPAAPVPGQPNAVPAAGSDKSYVRLTYRLPVTRIAAAFSQVNIPANITSTSVVHVRLMREEMQPDGTWGTPAEVPFLKNGAVIEPLPPAGALPADVKAFNTWAEGTGQVDLLRPTFYPVLSGEGPWDAAADDQLPKYDPNAEHQRQLEQLKAKQEAEKAKRAAAAPPAAPRSPVAPRTPSRTPPRTGRRGGGGGGGSGVARDPQRPADLVDIARLPFAQARPPSAPVQSTPGGSVNPGTPGGPSTADPAQTPAAVAPVPGVAPTDTLPPGNFQPALLTAPILGWIYDETVLEGHTYRYQVTYTLRNPVYLSNIVANPALSTQFAIESDLDDNAWSPEVNVKPTAEFYLASTNWTQSRIPGSIKINVFKWAQGRWQVEPFTVSPGDTVGESDKGVDYGTGATLVDIRYDDRVGQFGRAYVLLLTADGRLEERDPASDLKNPRKFQLQQQVDNPRPLDGSRQTPAGQPPAGQPPAAQPGGPDAPQGVGNPHLS